MADLENAVLAIRNSLYALLAAFCCVLAATCLLAWRAEPAATKIMTCGMPQFPGRAPSSGEIPAYMAGRALFIANCAACHNNNMKDKLSGPALGGTVERWKKFPRKDLYNYIRHPYAMTKQRHSRAVQLWKEWKPMIMNDFESLTDENIAAILLYIQAQSTER